MATHAGPAPWRTSRFTTVQLVAAIGLLGPVSAFWLRDAHGFAHERAAVPPAYPLNLVGQLRNGCTAFLVGPCHVATVAHCVYDPSRGIWWPGLEFSAGRNGPSAWDPFGRVSWRATEVPDGWKRSGGGDEAYDFALVVLTEPLGRRLGWMRLPGPAAAGGGAGGADGRGAAERVTEGAAGACSGAALEALAAASPWVPVGVAGYPDDRDNGTLWSQACSLRMGGAVEAVGGAAAGADGGGGPGGEKQEPWPRPQLLRHGCATRGGNSGSPLWLQQKEDEPGGGRGGAPCALAMHVAGRTRSTYDTAGRRTHSSSYGLAVSLAGAAGDWLREMVARHGGC
ncbi:hypothetical protein HYH03_010411 [Edaphochlamys debaryana]|uniref:Serine protease n=1 Tax=Edaphochlamys debaryana TaxID=47281 RepID=A0A836BW01_9CHLO|nr:hypothetical protein HYH03_010411 [Edaphochlamys debaryana]|eukprot:KAG2491201.1 hypothetical protein HYH03_010411 [Edaphochlamys debaryana]